MGVPLVVLGGIQLGWNLLGGILTAQGLKDRPPLKDSEGNWLPLHYMQHCRAEAGDLDSVYKDGHTVCDNTTGVPIARWSPGSGVMQPVVGFTVQGLPVYEDVPSIHPVWTTRRNVPSHLGTPGSEGSKRAENGYKHLTDNNVKYRRGDILAGYLGVYGPLTDLLDVPPAPYRGESVSFGSGAAGGILLIGAAALAAAGLWVPAGLVGAVGLLSGLGGSKPGSGGSTRGQGLSSGTTSERGGPVD